MRVIWHGNSVPGIDHEYSCTAAERRWPGVAGHPRAALDAPRHGSDDVAAYAGAIPVLASLLLAGAALRLSWRPAGLILQSFSLGYLVAMMAAVGMLYTDSPLRLCNAYRLDHDPPGNRTLRHVDPGGARTVFAS